MTYAKPEFIPPACDLTRPRAWTTRVASVAALAFCHVSFILGQAAPPQTADDFSTTVRPFLAQHCTLFAAIPVKILFGFMGFPPLTPKQSVIGSCANDIRPLRLQQRRL